MEPEQSSSIPPRLTASAELAVPNENAGVQPDDISLRSKIRQQFLHYTAPVRRKLKPIISWFEHKFRDLTFSQYCYFFAFAMLIAFLSEEEPTEDYALIVGIIGGIGLLKEMWAVFNKVWDNTLGKGVLLVLYAATANFALAISALKINSIAGIEPQIFMFTMGFTTLLMLPFWLLIASFIFLGSAMIVLNLWLLLRFFFRIFGIKLKVHWEDQSFALITMVMRICLIPFLVTVLVYLINPYIEQMDMFEPLNEMTFVQKLDPILVNKETFKDSNDEEIIGFIKTLREADPDQFSESEQAIIDEFELSNLQVDLFRGLSDKNLEKLLQRLTNNIATEQISRIEPSEGPQFTSSTDQGSDSPESETAKIDNAEADSPRPGLPNDVKSNQIPQKSTSTFDKNKDPSQIANVVLSTDEESLEEAEERIKFLNLMVANFIYIFETYPHSACQKEPHQRVLHFDEEMMFVAEKDVEAEEGYRFFVAACDPAYNLKNTK